MNLGLLNEYGANAWLEHNKAVETSQKRWDSYLKTAYLILILHIKVAGAGTSNKKTDRRDKPNKENRTGVHSFNVYVWLIIAQILSAERRGDASRTWTEVGRPDLQEPWGNLADTR